MSEPLANGGLRLNAILARLDGLYAKILSDERPSAVGFLTLLDSWRKEVLRAEKNFAALQQSLGEVKAAEQAPPELSELHRRLEFVQGQARDLEAAFVRQREEAEALGRSLEAKEAELDALRLKRDDDLSAVPELKRQAASSERAAKRAESAAERQIQEIAALRKEVEAKDAELETWQQRCKDCMADVPGLRKQAAHVEKMTQRSEAELTRQRERIESLNKALESKDDELELLRERRDKDSERIFVLEREVAQQAEPLKAGLAKASERIRELEARLAHQADELKTRRAEAAAPAPAPQTPALPEKPAVVERKAPQKAQPPKSSEKAAPTAKRPSKADDDAARDAYGALLSLFQESAGAMAALRGPLSAALSACLDPLGSEPGPLLAQAARSSKADYLWAHSANVALLSMRVALVLRLEKEAAHQVGLCGALHELRLRALDEGAAGERADQERKLNPLEPQLIPPHIARIEQTLGRSFTKSAEARLAAHAIALCDLYEALSHPRPWREPLLPHDAVMALARDFSKEYDRRVLQAFIASVTLYPPGSWVTLSSGEAGRVVSVSARTPTLPTVEVRLDADGGPAAQPALLDLSKSPVVHIAKAADDAKLADEAERWWP